ncbi:MAG: hypothetical protein ISR65_04455 [Bacteriovoracaceae bacterium]|nr:hypothetical protein [Bacteriovoracaceae bacterium]
MMAPQNKFLGLIVLVTAVLVVYFTHGKPEQKSYFHKDQKTRRHLFFKNKVEKSIAIKSSDNKTQQVSKKSDPFSDQYQNLSKLERVLDKHSRQTDLFSAWALKPKMIEYTVTRMSSWEELSQMDTNQQATFRVNAIKFLKFLAAEGDVGHTEIVAQNIISELDSVGVKKRRDLDLIDLINIWIDGNGKSEIEKNPEILFDTFNYKSSLRPYFATALRYSFPEKINNVEFINKFLPYLVKEKDHEVL